MAEKDDVKSESKSSQSVDVKYENNLLETPLDEETQKKTLGKEKELNLFFNSLKSSNKNYSSESFSSSEDEKSDKNSKGKVESYGQENHTNTKDTNLTADQEENVGTVAQSTSPHDIPSDITYKNNQETKSSHFYSDMGDNIVTNAIESVHSSIDKEDNSVSNDIDREDNSVTNDIDKGDNSVNNDITRGDNLVTSYIDREDTLVINDIEEKNKSDNDRGESSLTSAINRKDNQVTTDIEGTKKTDNARGESSLTGAIDRKENQVTNDIEGTKKTDNARGESSLTCAIDRKDNQVTNDIEGTKKTDNARGESSLTGAIDRKDNLVTNDIEGRKKTVNARGESSLTSAIDRKDNQVINDIEGTNKSDNARGESSLTGAIDRKDNQVTNDIEGTKKTDNARGESSLISAIDRKDNQVSYDIEGTKKTDNARGEISLTGAIDRKDNQVTNDIEGSKKSKIVVLNQSETANTTNKMNNVGNSAKCSYYQDCDESVTTVETNTLPLVAKQNDLKSLKMCAKDVDEKPDKSKEKETNHGENKDLLRDTTCFTQKTNTGTGEKVTEQFNNPSALQNTSIYCSKSSEKALDFSGETKPNLLCAVGNRKKLNITKKKEIVVQNSGNTNSDIAQKLPDKNINNDIVHPNYNRDIIFSGKINSKEKSYMFNKTDHITDRKSTERHIFIPNQKKEDKPRRLTFITKGIVNCSIHSEEVKYWCETCKARKCEKCVNIVYSKACVHHDVKAITHHVMEDKVKRRKKIQENSQTCLAELERSMKVLQVNEEQAELKELFQRDHIRQEFVSFHQLLIEEEQKILRKLDNDMHAYRSNNRLTREAYWQLVEEEARLMCETLHEMDKADPYGEYMKVLDKLMYHDWGKLLSKVKIVGHSVEPIPAGIDNTFSLEKQKRSAWLDLSNVSDPVEITPVSYTLYLEEGDISSPIKVSDLFSCKTSGTQVFDIDLQIEVFCHKQRVFHSCLKLADYMLNSDGKYHLSQNSRYLVKVRTLNRLHPHLSPWKHILIITGRNTFGIQQDAYAYITFARGMFRPFPVTENKTVPRSPQWPFSSMIGCRDFYDFSPEELRTIAYTSDADNYMRCFSLLSSDVTHNYFKHKMEYIWNHWCQIQQITMRQPKRGDVVSDESAVPLKSKKAVRKIRR